MTIALPTRYAANEFNLRKALEMGGLTIEDVEVVEMGYPDMTTALATGSIDAAISTEPAVTIGAEEGVFVRVAVADEFYPDHQIGGLTYNAEFAATDAARRFNLAFIQATRDYNDAFFKNEGRDEIVEILTARVTGHPQATSDRLHAHALGEVQPTNLGPLIHVIISSTPGRRHQPGFAVQHVQWWTRQEGGQISTVDRGSVVSRR
jgi:ABC-type nitrate/sulfonate/bicarbonate transport system substrate-binding protein